MSTGADEASPIDVEPLGVARRPRHGDALEVEIDGLDGDGVGVAKLIHRPDAKTATPWTLAIRHALPGERVRALVSRAAKRKASAQLVEVVRASPARVSPRCDHAGPFDGEGRGCGGCPLATMSVAAQRAYKHDRLVRQLVAAGESAELAGPIRAVDPPWRHRNKMEFSFGDDRDRRPTLGLHPPGLRFEVVDVLDCHLLPRFAMDAVAETRRWRAAMGLPHHDARRGRGLLRSLTVRVGQRTGAWLLELCTDDVDVIELDGVQAEVAALVGAWRDAIIAHAALSGAPTPSLWWTRHRARRGERTRIVSEHLVGPALLHEELEVAGRRLTFAIHPRAFFQPSTAGAEAIYAAVRALALEGVAGGALLDLYCGAGTIALVLADAFASVVGVELEPTAVDAARANAVANRVTSASFYAGDAAEVLVREGLDGHGRFDVVVVDPPRAGLSAAAIEVIARIAAPRLIYVSCNASSLARDLGPLRAAGYALDSALPVDQFPHAAHLETVARLRLLPGAEATRRPPAAEGGPL